MSGGRHINTSCSNDLLRLVRSDIRTYSHGTDDNLLFSKKREKHLIQSITLGLHATHDFEFFELRNSSQMSSHLTDVTTKKVHGHACLEI